ncbi:MAG TPA: Na+/H+ antiporter subunit E [Polyangiaceae bacterium]
MSLLKKLAPAPLSSVALFALWLALARSTSLGQVLLGLGLSLAVPLLTSSLRLGKARVRKPLLVVRYVLRVGYDVVRSNFEVARDVIIWRRQRPRSEFVVVPLELRDPAGLAALAMVTTVVPGTVWSELALDRSQLLLHVWNVGEKSAFVARYKDRYEKPLREIFE